MNTLFLSSQLKNMPWIFDDLVVEVDGETLTIATLIERYKALRAAVADVEKMTKTTTAKKPTAKTKKTTTEK